MIRLICPKCYKDSYRRDVVSFKPCSYCRFVFSGKYGNEKRKEKRIAREMSFNFSYHGQNFNASTVDSSKNGLCVKIFDRPPFKSGDIIDIKIKNLLTRANVVWMKKEPDKCLYGLRKVH